MTDDRDSKQTGPVSLRNWRWWMAGNQQANGAEFPLYSDAHIYGHIPSGIGPYALLNSVRSHTDPSIPVFTLRAGNHLPREPWRADKTDTSEFTGSSMADEIAALTSLCIGARVAAGEFTRWFNDEAPMGHPRADDSPPVLPLPPAQRRRVVPSACGDKQLLPDLLATFGAVEPADAVALIRAARSYRDALWIAESEPELAWLLLVAAVETAAARHVESTGEPEVRLREVAPELAGVLEKIGPDAIAEAAPHVAHLFKSTARFLRFIQDMDPPPPPKRPPLPFQVDWSPSKLRLSLAKIYDWRSKALHAAIPFPPPMCEAPEELGNDVGEKPSGVAIGTLGGTWLAKDAPMFLQTFEHIARECLQEWWRRLVNKS